MLFNKYFEKWLYSKDGYYSNYKDIGKSGDFFTAVSTSSFFGGSIAKRLLCVIEDGLLPSNTTVIEIGAHHGYLISDIIQFVYTLKPELLDSLNFAIIEKFEHLRKAQKEYLYQSFGDSVNVKHYSCVDELRLDTAFIVANEIFDAFPCDLVYTNDKNKLQIANIENHKIEFIDCKDEKINKLCHTYKITKGEISLGFKQFAHNLEKNINKFEFIIFDYGEKYPRNDFSLRVYEKHNVYPFFDKLISLDKLFGKTDITYDVNFSHLIDSFEENNILHVKYDTQLKVLVDFGIIELLEILHKKVKEDIYLREVNKVKTLLNPDGMGDRFKAVIFRKNINMERVCKSS
ncbi:COG1565: Uncharacterized conserved protein [hydrothermal vent metagenome]|uniref:COG1565: Uncharacterized conserved protein n=1 Tax=hydrothermal vent metagenome TaxID=652676 RepID=A0A3B1DT74_9ZZZZ